MVIDPTVALGVDVQVGLARPDLVQDDGDADRARAAEADLGIASPCGIAAIGGLLDQVLGLLAAEHQCAERRVLERVARRGEHEPPVG